MEVEYYKLCRPVRARLPQDLYTKNNDNNAACVV